MEHGGGNNSTFTTHVVTSSGTDTYSVISAALASLKGPKHGGANIKVVEMMQDLRSEVKDVTDRDEVESYLKKLLHKEAFDRKGLIYGMGHAVYSKSDPRAEIFKRFVRQLSEEKGRMEEFALYSMIEELGPKVITEERRIYKESAPMWTSTADLYTACWIFRKKCSRPSLQSPESWDGARTVLRN